MTSLSPPTPAEDLAKANKEIDEWMSIAAELKEKYPVLFEALMLAKLAKMKIQRKKSTASTAPMKMVNLKLNS